MSRAVQSIEDTDIIVGDIADAKEMKKSRKNIDILQVAATDKENLSRKVTSKKTAVLNNGRVRLGKQGGKTNDQDKMLRVDVKNKINKIKTEAAQQVKGIDVIPASDLTSDSGPSDKYWEKLAESRRIALESALKENAHLNNKLSEMEYENSKLKEMLSEAQTLVEVLTEMLEGGNEDNAQDESNKVGADAPGQSSHEDSSDDDLGNETFQSCS